MTDQNDQPAQMPDFFRGMACAYEDAAQFIETMRDNLPPEISFMASGFTTIADGLRAKIAALETTVAQNMAAAANAEGSMEQ